MSADLESKIQALLRVAAGNANKHEADNAMRAANRLRAKLKEQRANPVKLADPVGVPKPVRTEYTPSFTWPPPKTER